MPWKRTLLSVKGGTVSAAFTSSFKKDRAEFGAYPMRNGKTDPTRLSVYTLTIFIQSEVRPKLQAVGKIRLRKLVLGSSKLPLLFRDSLNLVRAHTRGRDMTIFSKCFQKAGFDLWRESRTMLTLALEQTRHLPVN